MIKTGTPEEQENAQQTWAAYTNYIQGLGMSQTEYDNTIGLTSEKSTMLTSQVYQNYIKTLPAVQQEDQNTLNQKWNSFVAGLVSKANVKMVQ